MDFSQIFLLSDKFPSEIKLNGANLKDIVNESEFYGSFTTSSFREVLEVMSDENQLEIKFRQLFYNLRSNVDLLIIDFDFLDDMWQSMGSPKEILRKYLIGIFCLSIMSAKKSECFSCPYHKSLINQCINVKCKNFNESKKWNLDVIVISPSGKKEVFPEFMDWLRDWRLKTHKIPICSKQDLSQILNMIACTFAPYGYIPAFEVKAHLIYEERARDIFNNSFRDP